MELEALSHYHCQGVPINQTWYPANNIHTWPFNIARLLSEKSFLEKELTICATYLHALRKKQAYNERRLNAGSSLPRRKRRQIEQVMRELRQGIKSKERDEQAFSNNLQACEANISAAKGLSYPSTDPSSTVPNYNSGSTRCSFAAESEPTELSWVGWTDDALVSPFQKQSNNNPFLRDEIAPDDCPDGMRIDVVADGDIKRFPLLVRCTQDKGDALLVPPNTAQSSYARSTLSPEAAAFDPHVAYNGHEDALLLGQHLDRLSISPSLTIKGEHMDRQRVADAGLGQTFRPSSSQQRRGAKSL